jgi:hypothetical protein
MSTSIARAPQRWLKWPWRRAVKTQMVKGKMMLSPRLYRPNSNEAIFVVFPISWPGRKGFSEHKSIYWKHKMTSTPHVDVEELKR